MAFASRMVAMFPFIASREYANSGENSSRKCRNDPKQHIGRKRELLFKPPETWKNLTSLYAARKEAHHLY